MREDELEVVPVVRLGISSGLLDAGLADPAGPGPRRGAAPGCHCWTEAYQARFEGPALAAGGDQRTGHGAGLPAGRRLPAAGRPRALGIYRRQQELAWTEHLVEQIESELEAAGVLGRPERVPAMSFLDLVGYTHLTEQRGDAAAAALAETLAVLVNRSAREHGGVPVKWLGDGVMVHYREPAGAVLSALELVARVPEAGLPRPMSGWRPGRWWPRAATTSAAPSTSPPGSPPTPMPTRCCQPARGRVGPTRRRALRGAGGAPAQGVRPSGSAAGGSRA